MSINDQQQAIIYKNDTEVSRHQYVLEETGSGILRYKITQRSGSFSFDWPEEGYFKVSSKQLILDSTPTDGPAYTFERN